TRPEPVAKLEVAQVDRRRAVIHDLDGEADIVGLSRCAGTSTTHREVPLRHTKHAGRTDVEWRAQVTTIQVRLLLNHAQPVVAEQTPGVAGVRVERPVEPANAVLLSVVHQRPLPDAVCVVAHRPAAKLAQYDGRVLLGGQVAPVRTPDG